MPVAPSGGPLVPNSYPPHRSPDRAFHLDCEVTRPAEWGSYSGDGLQRLGCPGGIIEDAFWPAQAVMLAKHRSPVFSAEQPPPLQDRDHLGAKHVELRRQQRRHDIEPVGRTVLEPVLDKIGDLLGRPGGDVMSARAGKIPAQLPPWRLVAPPQTDDHLGAAARRPSATP